MLALVASLVLAATPAPRCIQVVGTNDLHGHLDAEQLGKNGPTVGGISTLAAYVHALRTHYPDQVLLLDGGDLFQGTLASNLTKGAAVIAAYNAIGYQASALGNHEFDFGPEGSEADLTGAIQKRLSEAKFPFLACNVFDAKSGKRPAWKNLQPSMMVTLKGIKVGVIGAITPDTPTVTIPTNVASLRFADPAPEIVTEAARLRKEGAQIIVLTAHIGGRCTDLHDPHDITSCEPNSEIFSLVRKLPKGTLDVVVGGHTHQFMAQELEGVAITEAGSWGHAFSWIEACVGEGGKVTTQIHRPVDVCRSEWPAGGCAPHKKDADAKVAAADGAVHPASFLGSPVVPDAQVDAVVAPYVGKVEQMAHAPIGVTMAQPLERVHTGPSAIGRLIAAAMRASVPGAQIGVTNAGGIRADLPSGPLNFAQVFEVLPFDNRVAAFKVTGAELVEFLLRPLRTGHGFPQVVGADVQWDPAAPDHAQVLISGKPVDPKATFVLATNDFLAVGGGGATELSKLVPPERQLPSGALLRDALLAYLKAQPQPVKAP